MDALIDAGLVPYVDPLIAAQDEVIRAEDALTQAREVRGVLIAEQVKAGRSKYSIAQAIGISSQAVTEAVRRYCKGDRLP